jgi:hypothetical protein
MPIPCRHIVFGAAIALAGCAAAPRDSKLIVNGVLSFDARVERIGVALVRNVRGFSLTAPPSAGEMVKDTLDRFEGVPADPSMVATVPVVLAAGLSATLHVGAAGGLFGLSTAETKAAASTISAAAAEAQLEDHIARIVLAELETHYPAKVRNLPDESPPSSPANHRPVTRPARRATGPAHDITVRVRLLHHGLQARPRALNDDLIKVAEAANPPLALLLSTHAEATRTDTGEFFGGVSVVYESVPHTFTEWGKNNAELLRHELSTGREQMLQEIRERIK